MGSGLADSGNISAAVITGGHRFDVPGFQAVFRDMPGIDCYVQHQENWAADVGGVREAYDALLFYNMPRGVPDGVEREAFSQLGRSGQGIFLLHHAILAYEQWQPWADMVGIADRSFGYDVDQEVAVDVADADHPITRGMEGWRMVDETYDMASAGEGSRVLLTTDHPNSMRTLAWTRRHGRSRVFCFQSGHDGNAYAHPNFRKVVLRGIRWCAGRI